MKSMNPYISREMIFMSKRCARMGLVLVIRQNEATLLTKRYRIVVENTQCRVKKKSKLTNFKIN